ncbi:MAG: IS3 family transposase [Phycisphaerae bacterium]|nr:IS3 family transposase [Phycisphaerae bacterium]
MTTRRQFSAKEKVEILRLHLLEHKPISEVCEQYQLNPTVFYRWQKDLFDHGAAAFDRAESGSADRATQKLQKENTQLKTKLASKDEVIAEIMGEQVRLKKNTWSGLKDAWAEPDVRDAVVDYVRYWSERTGISYRRIVQWIGIPRSKFYQWRERYGKVNEHNAWIPRDFWLRDWEKQAILDFWSTHSREGYRRMTYMMLDADTVAVSPSTVYRVLQDAGVLHRWNRDHTSSKGQGFQQPVRPHEHWHIDISYINIQGTFYYLCSVLDGYSRYLVAWDLRESMTECHVEIVLQRAHERFPEARPRIISDNGPQFIAKDFKQFVRLNGMTHVRTSPYYPQSNGKMERWHQSAKTECIRPQTPQSLEDALRIVTKYVEQYNTVRLHSAIGYVTPQDKLEGRAEQILAARDAKLEAARQTRRTAAVAQTN